MGRAFGTPSDRRDFKNGGTAFDSSIIGNEQDEEEQNEELFVALALRNKKTGNGCVRGIQ
jgi:hypothetical protein